MGLGQVKEAVWPDADRGEPLEAKLNIRQFCFVNSYGLFRQMTETRPEILIEGSTDGANWKPYEFRWKPGDLSQAPRICAPYQPRLDWQMWFEALRLEQVDQITGTVDPRNMDRWFQSFVMQLLKGEPEVVGLLAGNPFPDGPPLFVRVSLWQYRFTDAVQRSQSGDWWQRTVIWVGSAMSLDH